MNRLLERESSPDYYFSFFFNLSSASSSSFLHSTTTPLRASAELEQDQTRAINAVMSINESEPTRLLFTSLHPSLSSQLLRTHLSQCPPTPPSITDIKVVTRPDGTSRCIAFAGFKSHLEADRVRSWASGAWIAGERGGSRIKVDWAKDVSTVTPSKGCGVLSPNFPFFPLLTPR